MGKITRAPTDMRHLHLSFCPSAQERLNSLSCYVRVKKLKQETRSRKVRGYGRAVSPVASRGQCLQPLGSPAALWCLPVWRTVAPFTGRYIMFTLLCISEGGLHVFNHRNVLTSQVKHDTLPLEKAGYTSRSFLHGNKHFAPNLPSLLQFHVKASVSTFCMSHNQCTFRSY